VSSNVKYKKRETMEEINYLLNIDVLGFGSFVNKYEIKTVLNYYAKLITGSHFAGAITNKDNIEVMVYSDTIAIKSNDSDQLNSLQDLIKVAQLIQVGQYYSALNQNTSFLPVRGTITYGEFIFYRGSVSTQAPGRPKLNAKNISLIFGKPIIESHNLEKDMEIICIALADSIIQKKTKSLIDSLVNSNLLIQYDIPLKKNKIKKGYIINPTTQPHFELNINRLETEKAKFDNGSSEYSKYINTINLFNYTRNNGLFYPNIEHKNLTSRCT
jgi:hypothetical protein